VKPRRGPVTDWLAKHTQTTAATSKLTNRLQLGATYTAAGRWHVLSHNSSRPNRHPVERWVSWGCQGLHVAGLLLLQERILQIQSGICTCMRCKVDIACNEMRQSTCARLIHCDRVRPRNWHLEYILGVGNSLYLAAKLISAYFTTS